MPLESVGLGDTLTRMSTNDALRKAIARRSGEIDDIDLQERVLLSPAKPGAIPVPRRYAIAACVAALHQEQALIQRYLNLLTAQEDIDAALLHAVRTRLRNLGSGKTLEDDPTGLWLDAALAYIRGLLNGSRDLPQRGYGLNPDEREEIGQIAGVVILRARLVAGLRQCVLAEQALPGEASAKGYSHDV